MRYYSAAEGATLDLDQYAANGAWRNGCMTRAIPITPAEFDRTRILERPDGFSWQAKDGGREYGPFATLVEAVADMQAVDNGAPQPGETLAEAESEIGIAEYLDPETGEPAEEERPRLEEH